MQEFYYKNHRNKVRQKSYEVFASRDQRAEVLQSQKTLLRILVDIGSEERTIVVANLAPATLCGVQSQGMLLAAKGEEGFELPLFSISHPGDPVA